MAAEIRPAAEGVSGMGILGMRGKKGLEAPVSGLLERANAMGMLLGRAWESKVDMRLAGGSAAVGLTLWLEDIVVVGVDIRCGTVEDCWVVGEALKLEFLLLMAEKSMRSSLLDSSCSSLGNKKEEPSPNTPEERMWRRSCLRLCEVIWLVEVKVKPQPWRMQWKWLVALL